jgi:hypothetical protein
MEKMKRYQDFKSEGNNTDDLTQEELKNVRWTKYKIVVPTLEDKLELEKAFEHIHYSDIDTDNIAVNQLAHEYLTEEITGDVGTINNIVVNEEIYNKLNESSLSK